MAAPDGDPAVRTLGELLPLAWTADDLTR